jgi:hypothetical protein
MTIKVNREEGEIRKRKINVFLCSTKPAGKIFFKPVLGGRSPSGEIEMERQRFGVIET